MKWANGHITDFPGFFNARMTELRIVKEWGEHGLSYRWVIIDLTVPESKAMQEFKRLPLWKRLFRSLPSRASQVIGSFSADDPRGGVMYLHIAQDVLDRCGLELARTIKLYERQMPATIAVIPERDGP
jgi:hypothetical protein